jgi:hypothetical protein
MKPETAMSDQPAASYSMPLERGKIREFAQATGSEASEYVDDRQPPIPPTFLRTAVFWSTPESSPMGGVKLDLRRILHGEQEYVFFGEPPRAGTELTVTSRLESVTEKEGKRGGTMTLIVVVDDFTDESGRLVAQGRSTLIQTAKAPS